MKLISSVIVMFSYLHSVCLVPRVLKNTYFKRNYSVVAFKHSICDRKNNTQEFKVCSMFKHSVSWKGMVYGPNVKGIMATMKYTPMVYSPNEKGIVLWKIVFRSGNCHGKRKKNTYKRYMSIKISFMFYALHEVDKSNDTSSFWRIWTSLYFSFAVFFFSKKVNLSKNLFFMFSWYFL